MSTFRHDLADPPATAPASAVAQRTRRPTFRRRLGGIAAALALLAAAAVVEAGSASASTGDATCHHGAIHGGTYRSLTVAGTCWFPDNVTITVQRNLTIAPGATLNPLTPGLTNFNMAAVHVRGDILVERHGFMGLGCSVAMAHDPMEGATSCSPTQNSDVEVTGSIVAYNARTMYLDGIHVHGDVISYHGGPGVNVTRQSQDYNFPVKDVTVDGYLVISGWQGGWAGIIRDTVGRSVQFSYNGSKDADSNEVLSNRIGGNLSCFGNRPAAQYGDATGAPGATPNVVGGHAYGQCKDLTQPFAG